VVSLQAGSSDVLRSKCCHLGLDVMVVRIYIGSGQDRNKSIADEEELIGRNSEHVSFLKLGLKQIFNVRLVVQCLEQIPKRNPVDARRANFHSRSLTFL